MSKLTTGIIILISTSFFFLGITSPIQAQEKPKLIDVSISNNWPKNTSLENKVEGLSKLWSEIKYNFVNIDKVDFDIDSLFRVTLTKAITASNDIEYYEILQRFMASFNDGHTQMILSSAYDWNEYFDYIPCLIKAFDNKFYFTSIRQNAGIDSTLLYSEIIEVEGLHTLQYVEERLFPMVSASTYSHKLMQATTRLMQGGKFTSLNGKARKRTGEIVDFSIIRNGETTRTENDTNWGVKLYRPDRAIKLDWDNNIAILQINTFQFIEINHVIDSLANIVNKDAKGLIIDLRYNGGGITSVARHLQMYLSDQDSIKSFGAQRRINNSYGRSQGNYRDEFKDFYLFKAYENIPSMNFKRLSSITPFSVPVVILIGPYSFSACEDFLVNIYEMPGRPLLVGEPTGGSTGAPLMVALPNNVWARICSQRITYPYSGKPFVGKGVQPDVLIKSTLEDYISERDVAKQTALDYLRNTHK